MSRKKDHSPAKDYSEKKLSEYGKKKMTVLYHLPLPLEGALRYKFNPFITENSGVKDLKEIVRKEYNDSWDTEVKEDKKYWNRTKSFGYASQIRDSKTENFPQKKSHLGAVNSETYEEDFIQQSERLQERLNEEKIIEKRKDALRKALGILEGRNPEGKEIIIIYYEILGKRKKAYTALARRINVSRPTATKRIKNALEELKEIVREIYTED